MPVLMIQQSMGASRKSIDGFIILLEDTNQIMFVNKFQ